jgi:hypothetical protein
MSARAGQLEPQAGAVSPNLTVDPDHRQARRLTARRRARQALAGAAATGLPGWPSGPLRWSWPVRRRPPRNVINKHINHVLQNSALRLVTGRA